MQSGPGQGYGGGNYGTPPAGAYPAGAAPPGGYPPAGAVPPGSYPPAGAAPPGSYPPAGAVPSGGYPPTGGPPAGYAPPAAPPSGSYQPPVNPPGGPPGPPPGGAEYREEGDWNLEPTAPPMEKMDVIPGYEPTCLGGGDLPPPTYDEAIRGAGPPDRSTSTNMPTLNEDEAREALMEHVSAKCCYGKGAAQELSILGLETTMAFHYNLESFTEARSTSWTVEPYSGQPVDGPQNGPAPGPWDIAIYPKQKFIDDKKSVEVPHTASVKPCHTCIGLCRVRCHHCHGNGRSSCSSCSGTGHRTVHRDGHHHHESCTWCHGSGHRSCSWCHGHGQVKCKTCNGRGQLKCYIKLTIVWKKHGDDHILERTALPDILIRKATGVVAFNEEHQMVWPVNHFPEQSINQASRQLVDEHRTRWPNERILLQRHRVRIVPVTKVTFSWKNKRGDYFVYGNEHLVHAPDYPQQCCCGCTIL